VWSIFEGELSYFSRHRPVPNAFALFRNFILLLSLLSVTACASAPSSVSKEAVGKIKTIGIISSLGSDLHFERVGAGGWDNDFYTVGSTALNLDPYFVGLIAKQLAGRFDVKPVKYNPRDFAPTSDDTLETLAAKVRGAAQPANLDTYLLVLRANSSLQTSGNTWDFSAQQVTGLGLTRKSRLTTHDYWAHALYVLVMVDGHTGKVLSETAATGGYQKLGFLEFPQMGGPYKDADETYWPEDPQHPSAAATAKLLEGILKPLFAESLPDALKAANLR
jgi:hypothetical protein